MRKVKPNLMMRRVYQWRLIRIRCFTYTLKPQKIKATILQGVMLLTSQLSLLISGPQRAGGGTLKQSGNGRTQTLSHFYSPYTTSQKTKPITPGSFPKIQPKPSILGPAPSHLTLYKSHQPRQQNKPLHIPFHLYKKTHLSSLCSLQTNPYPTTHGHGTFR